METSISIRRYRITRFLFVSLILAVAGCNENSITDPGTDPTVPPAGNRNMYEAIQANSNLNTLQELLEGTELEGVLSAGSSLTIFAPSDAAFARLPEGYLDGLSSQQKHDLLAYHIYSGSYPVINEIKREAIPSLHGDPIFVEIGQSTGTLVNNRATFDSTNIEARNGLIHVIDHLLIPDQYGTLADNLKKRYEYRKFYERIKSAGLETYLEAPGTKTVLAVNDMGIDLYEDYLVPTLTAGQWAEILKYHMLDVDFTVTGPGTRTALVTTSGDSIYLVVAEPGKYMINGGTGEGADIVTATNGKLISADGITLPDKYLGVLTVMDKRFYVRTARAALAVAKLTGRLYNSVNNADEEFTVFIPKNEADGINGLPTDEDELAKILKYHVLLEKVTADQLQNNQTYTTWQGEQIQTTRNGDHITINGTATVRLADLIGKNGVVHVIDQVLTPPVN